ncbi:uncharacterized protein [Typha latifolia]|uniref:uncharacterized protein n=1 Tax=Typha latifolia TaxID=4733 RepID=UPI003C30E96A
MDNKFGGFGFAVNSSSNPFQSWSTIKSGVGYHTDTTLRLDYSGISNPHNFISKGIKRKWVELDDTEGMGNASLSLGLGRPSNSSDSSKQSSTTACTMSSCKETDEECSMDLGLNFQLSLGNENTPIPKKHLVATSKALESEARFDLQLSLTAGLSESVITNTVPASVQYHDIFEASVNVSSVPTADEGSTSSRWKSGSHVLPYLYAPERVTEISSNQMISGSYCQAATSDLSPTMAQKRKSSIDTPVVDHQQNYSTSTKTCQFHGCGKGARGASGLCIAHGGGQRCQKAGCMKGAEGSTIFCKAHGGGRRCQHLGCTKSAEGRTDYCIAHGGGRRCSHEGCIRAARGKSGLCIRHGGGKRCQKENCTKSAEGHSGLCISHGGGRRCQFPECTKGAQGSTMLCKAHGGGKRCTFYGCTKGAEGSSPFCKGHGGGKRCSYPSGCSKSVHGGTHFCVAHGGGKRCAVLECTKSARGRTDYCVRHGGGKRCKFDGCDKSAQGSTDFCKAHGGGKRCSWGQLGSDLGAGGPPCDRFARGKIGLCAAHIALVEDFSVHGGHSMGAVTTEYRTPSMHSEMENNGDSLLDRSGIHVMNFMQPAVTPNSSLVSLPEGRVHGGSLMAILANSGSTGSHSGSLGEPKRGKAYALPHNWL